MAVPTITVGGVDLTDSIPLASIELVGSGMADSETLQFDVVDEANSLTVEANAVVALTESGGALTFGGFAQIVTPIHTAIGRIFRVQAISKGILLDRLLVPSLTRSAGESDYTRITYLLATYGTGLSATYTSIATLNASMPEQSFANMTLRAALEAVAALASSSATFYVDASGKLHYYASVPTAAPYAIKVGSPGGGEIAPEEIEVERDATSIINALYVQGENDLGSGWVTDATSIATYGRREAYLNASDSDTSDKRDTYGAAALADTKDPVVRGVFRTSSPYDGWAPEQTVTVTSLQDGLSAATFVIQKVTRTYTTVGGNRHYQVEFGGALPRLSASGNSPAAIPGRLLAPGSLSITPFASSIRPVTIVSSLPTLPDPVYPIGSFVYNTGDTPDTLYKTTDGTTWVKAVGADDIQANSITAGQIATGAISADEIAAGAVTTAKLAVGSVTADRMNVGGATGVLLSNPGFESGAFSGWVSYSPNANGSAEIELISTAGTKAGTGLYQLFIRKNDGNQGPWVYHDQLIPCRPGDYVSISALVGGAGPGIATVFYYNNTEAYIGVDDALLSPVSPTTGQRYTAVVGPAPASSAYLRVAVENRDTTSGYPNWLVIDDIRATIGDAAIQSASGNVLIDSDGVTINNGKLTLADEFGTTVMVASGFSGSWDDYVALGLLNPVFAAGVDTTLPEGRTANLPYWTVDQVTGTPTITRRTDAAFPSGHSVRIVFTAVNDKVYLDSDLVPVQGGVDYSVQAVAGWNKTVAGSTWVTTVYVRWYDGASSYISSGGFGPLGPAVGATGTQAPALFSWTAGKLTAPLTARYAQVRFYVEQTSAHDTGGHYWDVGMIRLGPAPTTLTLSGGHRFNHLILENYATVGDPLDTASFEVNSDASFLIDDNGTTIFRVSRSGLLLPGRGTTFPTDKITDDHYWRTDLDMEFFYDGTRWLSTQLFHVDFPYTLHGATVSATDSWLAMQPVTLHGGSDLWLENAEFLIYCNAGTLSGSNYWTFNILAGVIATDGITWNTKASAVLNSGTITTTEIFAVEDTIMALLNNGTDHRLLRFEAAETGTAVTILPTARLQYRVVAT